MKDQYFGDLKDLFKYDLILAICRGCKLNQIFFIPMLTKNDLSKQGFDTNYIKAIAKRRPGTQNENLMKYLMSKMLDGKRRLIEIKPFLKQ